MNKLLLLLLSLFLLSSCCQEEKEITDPLPSWNETNNKDVIIDFITASTNPKSDDFIPEEDRIAVFDNDGTLWSERPFYFQFEFAFDMVRVHAENHPEWKEEQPFKGILENDLEAVMASGKEGIGRLLLATHTGMNNAEFLQTVSNWIDTAHHKQTGKLYREMTFQPMLELLDFFRANGFKTYIVSGGSVGFMQPWIESLYGIPTEQVLGTRFKLEYEILKNGPVFNRLPSLEFYNDKGGKPENISQIIGKRPVAAFGNSDGDLAMLQYTAAGEGKSLMIYIHHTDAEREYAYDRESHIGKLNIGLDEAASRGWTVVNIKKDWNRIYPD